MTLLSSRRLLAIALGGAVALSALPAAWQQPWSPQLAAMLWAPLRPGAQGLAWLGAWLRTPADPYPGRPEELRSALEARDRLQGDLDNERQRSAALEAQLQELTGVWERDRRGGWRPVMGAIIERNGGRPPGLLGIDVGASSGVRSSDPVVTGGNQLVGLIAGNIDAAHAWVAPLDDRRVGRIDALVYPAAKPGASPSEATLVQLVPQGRGRLVGELESGSPVKPGDPVKLADPTWKQSAQGMLIGTVEAVGKLDANPLRTRIEVRMGFDPARLGKVAVKIEDAEAPARGAPPAPPASPARSGKKAPR